MKELLDHFDSFLENRMYSVEKQTQNSLTIFDENYQHLRSLLLTQCSETRLSELEDLLISNLSFYQSHYYRQGFYDGIKLFHHILASSQDSMSSEKD